MERIEISAQMVDEILSIMEKSPNLKMASVGVDSTSVLRLHFQPNDAVANLLIRHNLMKDTVELFRDGQRCFESFQICQLTTGRWHISYCAVG